MNEDNFFDIYHHSLNKHKEELCGDKVKFTKGESKSTIVLSDGLGSGVKANILATLTTEMLITMLDADLPLKEVIETIAGTLPRCQMRNIAYATFTIITISHHDNKFEVINFDNPPIFLLKKGRIEKLIPTTEVILDKKINYYQGVLERGDFLGAISDGILYAGLGNTMNFGWGWDNIAKFLETVFLTKASNSRKIIEQVVQETKKLYCNHIGDDATFVGVYVRKPKPLMIFTGPPLDPSKDEDYAEQLLSFAGRKIICGGTTGNIVANYMAETIDIDIATMTKELPPIGKLKEIDLVTEGILTISKAKELLNFCQFDISRLPTVRNSAVLLAKEILEADSIYFLVGQQINEFYQNPLLPKNISIRRSLIEELVQLLRENQKKVILEYC
ncbi:SpoIIE family protein phosphatase [Cyanobacterium aponinum UTEX 3222]|uniref:Stage II sporulation protein E n=3 Tax=Cyanobacterium aponinum TaxID=379064 RepID=K9Z8M5_CYAAP|nr:SpoIIE family protein phosphatase [Cyanobacterium aponinum]WRL43067.1 SpoIIE family protein phosphatase [Cyanobacterium aponinum UTEX 3222]AFZ54945.1 Stage II sporulation protein E [Cyanobacterium aponinum PCC 10605]MBD2394993.1 SpoIIE family protein phosphatase [Cyanobacterium aponinum FACHB-4101]MTF39892.1 SpoIIE family protein phosphatase [Cyanobacterium aponinum 0216]PHV61381.1 serine/threonine protein phosphatase [Cyanobacterium aponinum IPPAS B-1201]